MNEKTARDNEALIEFWSSAFAMSDEEMAEALSQDPGSPDQLAPSQKLCEAARSLSACKKVLDYGCGNAWAAIIAAKYGCGDVTAVDPARGAVIAAEFMAKLFGAEDKVHTECILCDWLGSVPEGTFDGFICSNVLDTVPPETADRIIRDSARATAQNASVIIGLNYYMPPEAAAQRGIELEEGCMLYVDGVLRLVSRSDEEWARLFSPYYEVERLEHFAWPGEETERRRLFYLKKK